MPFWNIFHNFPRKWALTFHANWLLRRVLRQFAWNIKAYFLSSILYFLSHQKHFNHFRMKRSFCAVECCIAQLEKERGISRYFIAPDKRGYPHTVFGPITAHTPISAQFFSGLGGSVGSAVRLETRRSWVQPPPRSATFFRRDWLWNIFYSHSLPSADSRLSLPNKRVVR